MQNSANFKVFRHFGSGISQRWDTYPQIKKIPSANPTRTVKIKKNNSIQRPLFRHAQQIFQKGTTPFQKSRDRILYRHCPKSGVDHGTKDRIHLPCRRKISVKKQRECTGNTATGALESNPSRGATEPPIRHGFIREEKKSQKKNCITPDANPSE